MLISLGIAEFGAGDRRGAIAHLRRATELSPTSASAWFNLGEALKQDAQTAGAMAALRTALRLEPAHVKARLSLARALASVGEIAESIAEFRAVLRREPRNARAWFGLSNLNTLRFAPGDVQPIRVALERAIEGSEEQAMAAFALAKAIEDQQDYPRAWDAFKAANAIQRKRVRWDSAGEHRRALALERVCSNWDPPPPVDAQLGHAVIMVTGMPRSGTSLVEQILASHPAVEGANEIADSSDVINAESQRRHGFFPLWLPEASAADWHRLGVDYLARTARWRVHRPRFTDKNLGGWYTAGAVVAMLPAAKIVIVRRNPLETCLACYRQWFSEQSGYAYDLDELATYCIDFLRVSRFWVHKFPGRVLDLEYETLTAEPEATIRRLLDFCGLSFDAGCLEFHKTRRAVLSAPSTAQVRQPMRCDTARAARYGHLLDGLRQRLRDAGIADV